MSEIDELVPDEAKLKDKPGHPFNVTITYNGVNKHFTVRPDELIKTLLAKGVEKFGPIPNAHILSLFDAAGNELDDSKTIEAANVQPRDILLLRPSTVKGGS